MNQQVKAGLSAVRDFLAGRSADAKPVEVEDKDTRKVVGAELLAAMSGEVPRAELTGAGSESRETADGRKAEESSSEKTDEPENSKDYEPERARKLFLDHGYFDEAVENLRSAKSPAERAAAARALGLFGSQRGTPHLIAAMFDEDVSVRNAAEEALAQIADPTVTEDSIDAVMMQERNETTPVKTSHGAAHLHLEQSEPGSSVQQAPAPEIESAPIVSVPSETGSAVAARLPRVGGSETQPSEASTEFLGSTDESQLLEEETNIRATIEKLDQQIIEAHAAFTKAENEIRWRTERESKLRVEAAERLREEEEQRKRAEQEAEARRTQEQEAFAAEQSARATALADAQRLIEDQKTLQLKAVRLRLAAGEIAIKRSAMENARLATDEAQRQAELRRARDDAQSIHEAELTRLRREQESLQSATDEVVQQQANVKNAREQAAVELKKLQEEQTAVEAEQRAEADRLRREAEEKNRQAGEQLRSQLEDLRQANEGIAARRKEAEAARAKADTEAERLVEALARMRSAEEARAQAEAERAQREAEINQQVENERRLLAEAQRRGEEEKQRLGEEIRRQAEAEEKRLAELEAMRSKAESESKLRTDKEQEIRNQIDSIRIADAETRKRIADAENLRRSADEAYRLVAEKVQRVEAEAHARAKEEERIIAKLESERRTVAIEAQSRAEQERRIKEEIEMFRRLEDQERPRLEEATLQLAAAEARLEERRERLKAEEEARLLAEDQLSRVDEAQTPTQVHAFASSGSTENDTTARPVFSVVEPNAGASGVTSTQENFTAAESDVTADLGPVVAPAITTYLNSVDPYKRAAAVAELARSGADDAFALIVNCFDDHSPHVRNAAARAFRKLEPTRTVDLFNRALEGASNERRQNIGAAIAASGLATEAIDNLNSENREDTYNALSVLFVMAKTGEVEPLVRAIEGHESVQVRMAAIKLLTLTGQSELANSAAKRRLDKQPLEIDHLS